MPPLPTPALASDLTDAALLEAQRRATAFIERYRGIGGERANKDSFLKDLCDVLDVPHPEPKREGAATADPTIDAYCFERNADRLRPDGSRSHGKIDLYRRGCFILEAKGTGKQPAEPTEAPPAPSPARRRKNAQVDMFTEGATAAATRLPDARTSYDSEMHAARQQAEEYSRGLPATEPQPPFLLVVDLGSCFEIYSEFSLSGKIYEGYPTYAQRRILFENLVEPSALNTLRAIWLDPLSLDPSRRTAQVTTEIARELATVAAALESLHGRHPTARFLMRCILAMYAEDAGLLLRDAPKPGERPFTELLQEYNTPKRAPRLSRELAKLWLDMDTGGVENGVFPDELKRFNGGLFAPGNITPPLTTEHIGPLLRAAQQDWRLVEPAIFGTLLERALDEKERARLGAHYTPRAYVERLVLPTIIEPLREQWAAARAHAAERIEAGQPAEAMAALTEFHARLCATRVLDPACGTGNFLYVSLDLMKRLEDEVRTFNREYAASLARAAAAGAAAALAAPDAKAATATVARLAYEAAALAAYQEPQCRITPRQFFGLEINPGAATIAEVVLWIGYLQCRVRETQYPHLLPEPLLENLYNIECRDALLEHDPPVPRLNPETGEPLTRWDGATRKRHPTTGKLVPDEAARTPICDYPNARKAQWPEADFIVGNPPFIGTRRLRNRLGDGYVEALMIAHPDVSSECDFVMYWWHSAASLLQRRAINQFGFITTHSITQKFNRGVVRPFLENVKTPISIVYAIPDHPWYDEDNSAAIQIAMTVANYGDKAGRLVLLSPDLKEAMKGHAKAEYEIKISADLSVSTNSVCNAYKLAENKDRAYWGVKFYGDGFILQPTETAEFLDGQSQKLFKHFVSARDLTGRPSNRICIDCDGLDINNLIRDYPEVYQHLLLHVLPVRSQNPRKLKRDRWWIFGENQPGMRDAISHLERFIVTPETAKHRFFTFLPKGWLAEGTVTVIAWSDAYYLGILSSAVHIVWALATGGLLGPTPRYNKTVCFDTFPFPEVGEELRGQIRELGETIDAHRKARQALHPSLTMTALYNTLEKIRAGAPLTPAEQTTNQQGLATLLLQHHQALDALVLQAYHLPPTAPEPQILERLIQLNHERSAATAK